MTTFARNLYLNFDPGVMELLCSFVRPTYCDYMFRRWEKLKIEECLFYADEYGDTEILRYVWNKMKSNVRYIPYLMDKWNEFIIIGVYQRRMELLEFLMSVHNETFQKTKYSTGLTNAIELSRDIKFREAEVFLKKYHLLIVKQESSFSVWRKNNRKKEKARRVLFRR